MSPSYVPAVLRTIRGTTFLLVIVGLIGFFISLFPQAGDQNISDSNYSSREIYNSVSNKLVSQPEVVRSNPSFSFHLLYAPDILTAFVIPTGQIYVTSGLLDRLETEDQLAAVLAHEMAHFLLDHFESPGEGSPLSIDEGLADTGDPDLKEEQTTASGFINELEADFWGMCLLQQAGYNPDGFIGLLKILETGAEGKMLPPTTPSTHPLHQERIKLIEENLHNMEHCFPER